MNLPHREKWFRQPIGVSKTGCCNSLLEAGGGLPRPDEELLPVVPKQSGLLSKTIQWQLRSVHLTLPQTSDMISQSIDLHSEMEIPTLIDCSEISNFLGLTP